MVSFESYSEWSSLYTHLSSRIPLDAQALIWLNAVYDAPKKAFVWRTNGEELTGNPAWYDPFPLAPDQVGKCVFAYFGSTVNVNNSWTNSECDKKTTDFVCEFD